MRREKNWGPPYYCTKWEFIYPLLWSTLSGEVLLYPPFSPKLGVILGLCGVFGEIASTRQIANIACDSKIWARE